MLCPTDNDDDDDKSDSDKADDSVIGLPRLHSQSSLAGSPQHCIIIIVIIIIFTNTSDLRIISIKKDHVHHHPYRNALASFCSQLFLLPSIISRAITS